jgi:hypothetical protein
MSRTGQAGWQALVEWALAFALLALTLIGAASIGMFVAPFAIAAMVFAVRRNRDWPEAALGGSAGAGATCLFIAYRNRGYVPCPPSGTPMRLGPGEHHFACGGFDPMPWLAIGLVLAVTGLGGYVVFRRAHRSAGA